MGLQGCFGSLGLILMVLMVLIGCCFLLFLLVLDFVGFLFSGLSALPVSGLVSGPVFWAGFLGRAHHPH